jgi:sulfatase modifying factor 1
MVSEDPLSDALCRKGMLLVDGTTCADPKRRCEEPDAANGCRRFAPASCRSGLALRFCIDGNEYPNLPGMVPAVMLTFRQAEDACEAEGKRLCTEAEWTFACEGPLALSFSYGDEMTSGACNVGRETPRIPPEQLWEARNVAAIVDRVDARVPSASLAGCVSPFGVRDLVGNVEEWVRSDIPGFGGALRGGAYSGYASCRTVRQMREPGFRQFHTGFRCCDGPLVRGKSRPARSGAPRSVRPGLVAPRAGFD